ncbi:MAG: hypothetical protein L6Q33_08575 [Bacteriovoracaceae bacterium]|nr:hypothetical protein [Bacteriovoracaceae bacterium]
MIIRDCGFLLSIIARIEKIIIDEKLKRPELLNLSDEELFLAIKKIIDEKNP